MNRSKLAALAVVPLFALPLAACDSSGVGGGSSATATGSGASGAGTTTVVKKIAFFGFWKSNSFTQAVLQGVKQKAPAGAEVVDLSTPQYDAAGQIKAVQDQTVKKDAQLYVVLANDSVGMATAAKEAIAAGITVVAAYTPLGPDFNTLNPQVNGLVVVAETPVSNGTNLGQMAVNACGSGACKIAYLEGIKALPLDNARTKAFVDTVAAKAPNAKIVARVEGGYSADTGKKAAQDALQVDPGINVMVGSSQAILGAQSVVDATKVKLIGNGASKEAFAAVKAGTWYALYNTDVVGMGAKAVELGVQKAAGTLTNPVFNIQDLRNPLGTKDVIGDQTSTYSDLS